MKPNLLLSSQLLSVIRQISGTGGSYFSKAVFVAYAQ